MANPLSPAAMLATSMHAQPGVYAVLLGSGVSTGAGIPTGWGVVSDLVRRIAAVEHPDTLQEAEDDPEKWWLDHHGEGLGYSSLLKALAPCPAARQGLLAGYFAPTDDERERGIKTPNKGHLAIAQLVKRGRVKVIITTNFDRLMEQALDAVGVAPQVISRPEAVAGMKPLAHAPATVIKLHGDYLDLGSRNTPSELESYPDEWNTLMERVLDEYGLIISGWSADWDNALVALMEASPNRRYPLYWDSRSSKGEPAQRLLKLRSGNVIQTAGADEMFTELLSNVDALDRLAEPPLTTAMAVARLKRYLPNPIHRIDLHDLVMGLADKVVKEVEKQPLVAASNDPQWYEDVLRSHLTVSLPLLHVLAAGAWHDEELVQARLWTDVVQRLVDAGTGTPGGNWITGMEMARLYPALLATTVLGLISVRRDREELIIRLAEVPQGQLLTHRGLVVAVAAILLDPQAVIDHQQAKTMPRWKGQQPKAPASRMLRADVREALVEFVPSDDDYRALFNAYEYRLALIHMKHGLNIPYGEYIGDRAFGLDDGAPPEVEKDFKLTGDRRDDWPWFAYFGSPGELERVVGEVHEKIKQSYVEGRWY